MTNAFCKLLGIHIPIAQAAMSGAGTPRLAASVSNAGGLGMLAHGWKAPEEMRAEIREMRKLTDYPFGVNLVMYEPVERRLAICLEEGVSVISFFWGQAGPLINVAHAAGAKVIHIVASAEAAHIAVEDGADAIVAQGWEAGGHVHGCVATMALIPAVVDRVGPVPVIAAGGISDGRGLAAAMALGAAGAWVGTRFLASHEANVHPLYQQRLIDAQETDTEYGMLFDVGWHDAPHRALRNTTFQQWNAAGRPPTGARPNEHEQIGTSETGVVVAYQSHTARMADEGDIEAMSLWAGQGVGQVRKVQPAADIVREIYEDAKTVIRKLGAQTL